MHTETPRKLDYDHRPDSVFFIDDTMAGFEKDNKASGVYPSEYQGYNQTVVI
jgi:hypothetical protein